MFENNQIYLQDVNQSSVPANSKIKQAFQTFQICKYYDQFKHLKFTFLSTNIWACLTKWRSSTSFRLFSSGSIDAVVIGDSTMLKKLDEK